MAYIDHKISLRQIFRMYWIVDEKNLDGQLTKIQKEATDWRSIEDQIFFTARLFLFLENIASPKDVAKTSIRILAVNYNSRKKKEKIIFSI